MVPVATTGTMTLPLLMFGCATSGKLKDTTVARVIASVSPC